MKKIYQTPQVEVYDIEDKDIVTISNPSSDQAQEDFYG